MKEIHDLEGLCVGDLPLEDGTCYSETSIITTLRRETSQKIEDLMTKICNASPSHFGGCKAICRFCA